MFPEHRFCRGHCHAISIRALFSRTHVSTFTEDLAWDAMITARISGDTILVGKVCLVMGGIKEKRVAKSRGTFCFLHLVLCD